MGCAGGMCGVPARPVYVSTAGVGGAGCAMCEADKYRLRMSSAFNPWTNAGANPTGQSNIQPGTINPATGQPWTADEIAGGYATGGSGKAESGGSGSKTGTDAGYALLNTAITEAGQTARAQIAADAARARADADARAAAAAASESRNGVQTRNYNTVGDANTQPASGGSGGGMMLLLLGGIALVATGAVKLPGRGR